MAVSIAILIIGITSVVSNGNQLQLRSRRQSYVYYLCGIILTSVYLFFMFKFIMLSTIVFMSAITANGTLRSKYLCGSLPNAFMSSTGCGNYNGCDTNCGSSAILPPIKCQTSCNNINCKQLNGNYMKESVTDCS
ncbi:hypothetical protein KIN20_011443 [Parelaphostrongylus tenuis]|uniref:Transmembrane protein n=1 Tax=Parelaphostrongylus tenuis TaxID=148309 RepID=A0AAD5M9D1_PARTN|nr:hypothetical protein KIN20_011443 [Parelaphostrongylus tenuis]